MILKICDHEWNHASRDKRELSACRELGEAVMVLAKGKPSDRGRVEVVDGFEVRRYSTRPLGEKVPKVINRVWAVFLWAHYVRKELQPEIISGHNIPGLFIGWLSNIGRKDKAALIYDSHEFELGHKTNRSKLQVFCVKHLERFLMKRCAFSIMVNDSIADEVQRIHKLEQRPIVVRSTPEKWSIDRAEIQKVKTKFAGHFPTEGTILMYHGAVTAGRGIEKLLEVVKAMPEVNAVILGNGSERYLSSLKKLTDEYGITERVLFHPAVPIGELRKYVGAADVGMILAPASCKNHLYSLPNKFFENIQSETPVICPCYPAMKELVDQYQFGLTCDPESSEEICACVRKMQTDRVFYETCKSNIVTAKEDLCWEKEKQVLMEAITKYLAE